MSADEGGPRTPRPVPGGWSARLGLGRASADGTRFRGAAELDPTGDVAAQLTALAEEILVHLQRGADSLEIAVSIDATRRGGFDRDTVRTVTENARVLGLKPGRFTEG